MIERNAYGVDSGAGNETTFALAIHRHVGPLPNLLIAPSGRPP